MMGKREVCLAAMYMNDAWTIYYEADIKKGPTATLVP